MEVLVIILVFVGLFVGPVIIVGLVNGSRYLAHLFRKRILGARLDYAIDVLSSEEARQIRLATNGNVRTLDGMFNELTKRYDAEENTKELVGRVQQYIEDLTERELCVHSIKDMPGRQSFIE